MSRVDTNGTAKAHVLTPQNSFNSAIPKDGHDERGSLSGSDDGSYAPYPDGLKNDVDNEEENNSLISQTLNTDGTPKRPMNAFMIFARRRRPQVSAENQAMRTGEVSKILSKEWSAMPAAEKQFYQDQARQLKEWFNSKYPDYVYRRRPNHSRRPRRKPDMPTENVSVHDAGDDAGFDDSAESPHDGDDSHGSDSMGDGHRSGTSAEGRPYGDQGKSHNSSSRASSYTYPMFDGPYRANGRHDNQLPYPSTNGDRYSNSPSSSSHLTPPLQYPLVSQSRTQSHSTPLYSNGSVDHENWNISSNHSRPSSWLGNGSERSFPPLVGDSKVQEPLSHWHRQPVSSSGNLAAGSSPESTYVLPTLNSPFFPDQAQHASHSPLSSYSPSDVSTTLPVLGERHYDDHSLSIPSTNGTGSYSTSGRNSLFYPTRGPTQTLPSISSYSQSHPPAGLASLKGYW